MSNLSAKKRLYDLILDKLNENTYGVEFSGNFMFRFWSQSANIHDFEIIYKEVDIEGNPISLEYQVKEVVPFVDVQTVQIPFVERNERNDWEKEFYVAIKIDAVVNEFNQRVIEFQENNPRYQALLETIQNLSDNLIFTEDGYKYAFKVKEPAEVNVFKYNGDYYQLLSLNFNLTSMKAGYFGNETELYFGLDSDTNFGATETYRLDFTEIQVLMGKESNILAPVDEIEHRSHINKRTWSVQATVNFIGNTADILLSNEVHGIPGNNRLKYKIRLKRGNGDNPTDFDYTREVYVTNANTLYINNSVESITFKVERV